MSNIPIEIGTHIASLVSFQGDLASLCLISPSWLETSRPFLYRKLKMNYGSSTLKDIMLMLDQNKLLKLNVKSLYLDGNGVPPTEEFTAEWNRNVNLDGMEKIRSLYISGFHWSTSPDSLQQNPMILQLLSQIRIPLLDEFKISIYTPISQPVRPVIEFLAAHPSLRHFSISSNDALYFDETSPKDILLNLISLSTNYFVFIEMYGVFFSGDHLTSLEFNSELPFHMEQKERGMAEAGLLGKLVGHHIIKRLSHYKTWQQRDRLVARVLKNLGYVAPSIEHVSLLELHSLDNKADRVSSFAGNIKYIAYLIP